MGSDQRHGTFLTFRHGSWVIIMLRFWSVLFYCSVAVLMELVLHSNYNFSRRPILQW